MFRETEEIESFIRQFETGTLPKDQWTHQAHFVVGLWYVARYPLDKALDLARERIRAYNEAVGTENSDSNGYHETLTRFYLYGIAAHLAAHRPESFMQLLSSLLQSKLVAKDRPFDFYSRERLFSVEARRNWLVPDLIAKDELPVLLRGLPPV